MVRQRAVREAESSVVVKRSDAVDDPASVQGPEPEMADEDRDDGSGDERRPPWERFDPTDVELLSRGERGACPVEVRLAAPNCDDRLIETTAARVPQGHPDRAIGERQFLRVPEESVDGRWRRTLGQEHEDPQVWAEAPTSASRIKSSTAITKRRTEGTRSVRAAQGRSCCVSDTCAAVARCFRDDIDGVVNSRPRILCRTQISWCC
jgi:hypothetical protein